MRATDNVYSESDLSNCNIIIICNLSNMLQNPDIRDYGCPTVTLTLIKAALYNTKITLFF